MYRGKNKNQEKVCGTRTYYYSTICVGGFFHPVREIDERGRNVAALQIEVSQGEERKQTASFFKPFSHTDKLTFIYFHSHHPFHCIFFFSVVLFLCMFGSGLSGLCLSIRGSISVQTFFFLLQRKKKLVGSLGRQEILSVIGRNSSDLNI